MEEYYYYFILKELFEFIACGIISILSGIVFFLVFSSKYCKHPKATGFRQWVTRTVIEPTVEAVFGNFLKKHLDKDGQSIYIIFNCYAPQDYSIVLFSYVGQLIGIAFMQFWDDFLFEVSHICSTDPDLACFRSNPNMTTPCLDCSNTSYLEDNNITSVICYRYVFRIGTATGSALGTVTATALIICFITYISINGICCNKIMSTIINQVILIIVTIGLVVTLIYFQITLISVNKYEVITSCFKYFTIGIIVVNSILGTPFLKFERKQKEKKRKLVTEVKSSRKCRRGRNKYKMLHNETVY